MVELYLWSCLVFFSVEAGRGGVLQNVLLSMQTSSHMH